MKKFREMSLSVRILIGLIIGIVVGIFLQDNPDIATTYIEPLGQIFLRLIRMVIVPLVFSSLVVGVGGMDDVTKIGRVGLKTFIYFTVTTALAIIIGLILGNVLNVGAGFVLEGAGELTVEATESPALSETLINIIPSNPIASMVEGDMLQIIVWAIIFGVALLALGDHGKPVFDLLDIVADAMYKITAWIMELAPIGVFGLIVPVIATNGPEVLMPLLKLVLIVYLSFVVHVLLVYTPSIRFLGGRNPIEFYKKAFPAWATAFTTSSSSGTLPVSMQVTEDLGVSQPIASFVLPLGATVNMDGTAIFQGVCALFIAQVYGIDLTLGQQLTIVLTATLASIGTAGVPGAGLIMLSMVLQSVGLPLEGIALVAGVERFLDMGRTSINVLGDISASVFIQNTEGGFKETNAKTDQVTDTEELE